jgi:arginyl-tRNA--protein-N-Asp/Glu arginylyltransferase
MAVIGRYPRLPGNPPEWLVSDVPMRCPYLPHKTARLPLRLPVRPLRRDEFAVRLEDGDRRQGVLLYRPNCPTCRACEAIRIDVGIFEPSKSQRRVWRRGEATIETHIGRPTVSAEKVALYNRHKVERQLLVDNELVDADSYEQFLVETCTDSIELSYRCSGRLIGVAIADRASDALSAVYCFYDPSYAACSPGTYSILKQVALCHTWGLRYLYLGLYVADCESMNYKAGYLPHERLIGGVWQHVGKVTDTPARRSSPPATAAAHKRNSG